MNDDKACIDCDHFRPANPEGYGGALCRHERVSIVKFSRVSGEYVSWTYCVDARSNDGLCKGKYWVTKAKGKLIRNIKRWFND